MVHARPGCGAWAAAFRHGPVLPPGSLLMLVPRLPSAACLELLQCGVPPKPPLRRFSGGFLSRCRSVAQVPPVGRQGCWGGMRWCEALQLGGAPSVMPRTWQGWLVAPAADARPHALCAFRIRVASPALHARQPSHLSVLVPARAARCAAPTGCWDPVRCLGQALHGVGWEPAEGAVSAAASPCCPGRGGGRRRPRASLPPWPPAPA